MRMNKSFIVKRSVSGVREMMKALSHLSDYIFSSLQEESSIWIAQKEGRAKDGFDKTDPAIVKMFYVNGKKKKIAFADYINQLNIVPVAVSYEFDPCDQQKAQELYDKAEKGEYKDHSNRLHIKQRMVPLFPGFWLIYLRRHTGKAPHLILSLRKQGVFSLNPRQYFPGHPGGVSGIPLPAG